jgi:hypothetical protein
MLCCCCCCRWTDTWGDETDATSPSKEQELADTDDSCDQDAPAAAAAATAAKAAATSSSGGLQPTTQQQQQQQQILGSSLPSSSSMSSAAAMASSLQHALSGNLAAADVAGGPDPDLGNDLDAGAQNARLRSKADACPNTCVYVGFLGWWVTEKDLHDFFSPYGELVSVRVSCRVEIKCVFGCALGATTVVVMG